jgi:hypothetical protein
MFTMTFCRKGADCQSPLSEDMFPLIRFNPNTQLLFYFLIKKQLFSASLLQESKSKFPRQILATSAKNVGDYSPVQSTAFLKRALSIGPLF